jgi:TRAP-type transport system periplasmic protein
MQGYFSKFVNRCGQSQCAARGSEGFGVIRIGGYQGAASVLTQALESLVALLREDMAETPVTVERDVTQGGATARSLFDGVESGAFTMAYMASGYFSQRVPALRVLDLPMTVTDRRAALAALDGPAGGIITAAIEVETGLKVLGFWDNGFRHISNGIRLIRRPADCVGLTIRTLDSPIYIASLAAMGFTPVMTDVRDFMPAISSGRIAAQENPLTNLLNFGVQNHHRHLSLTSHVFGVALLACNRDWHDGLGPVGQERLQGAAAAATTLQRKLAADEDERVLSILRADGMSILGPYDVEMDAFQRATAPIRESVARDLPAGLRDAYLG